MTGHPETFIEQLVERHPGLRPRYDAHRRDYGMLPHVFFGDVTRYYKDLCNVGQLDEASRLVAFLDEALATTATDDVIENLIHVSFLENLDHEKQGLPWELLSPRLKAGFHLVHRYTGQP